MQHMMSYLTTLQSAHAAEGLLVFAALLVLVDYFFPTDWPAHVAYVAAAAASFFWVWTSAPGAFWGLVASGILAFAVWLALAIAHRLFFVRFLENAPGTPGYRGGETVAPAGPGIGTADEGSADTETGEGT